MRKLILWFSLIFPLCGNADIYDIDVIRYATFGILKIRRLSDDGKEIASVEYTLSRKIDKLKQTTLVINGPSVDWAPVDNSIMDGAGINLNGLRIWMRHEWRLDGVVLSGNSSDTVVIHTNRVILGHNEGLILDGDLTVTKRPNSGKNNETLVIRGEVVIRGNLSIDMPSLAVNQDSKFQVFGTLKGAAEQIHVFHRARAQLGRIDLPNAIKFRNDGWLFCDEDCIVPQATIENVQRDCSHIPDTPSTQGQMIVNGKCVAKNIKKRVEVMQQRNISQELVAQYKQVGQDYPIYSPECEHLLVRQQMINLIGRRFLPGFTNELDQLWQLYLNTIEEHHRLKVEEKFILTIGQHLTWGEQCKLKKDIVWMVEYECNGQKTYAIRLYLCNATMKSIKVAPAMVIAGDIHLTSDGNLTNMGLLEATQGDVTARVPNILFNQGGSIISRAGQVDLQAGAGIFNVNGYVQGASGVRMQAPLIVSQTEVAREGNEDVFHPVIGGEASIRSGGDISIGASERLVVIGSKLIADGDIQLNSGDIIHLGPVSLEYRDFAQECNRMHELRGRHGILPSVRGRNIVIGSHGILHLEAPRVRASQTMELASHRNRIEVLPFIESEYAHCEWEDDDFFGSSSGNTTDLKEKVVRPKLKAGEKIKIYAHDDLETVALKSKAPHLELTSKKGKVQLKAAQQRTFHQEQYSSHGLITTTEHNEGYNRIEVIEPQMIHDDVRVVGRVIAEVRRGHLEPWVIDLCKIYDVDLREVLETNERWYHHTTHLSAPFRTFLMLGITIAGIGLGADFVAAHWEGISETIANSVGAALSAITTTATVSFVENGGDIGKVFKELMQSSFIKNMIAGALSAGMVSKFVDTPLANKALDGPEGALARGSGKTQAQMALARQKAAVRGLPFAQHLSRNLQAAAIETGAHSALEGGPVGRNLTRRMAAAAVHAGSARLAHKIGQRYAHGTGDMSWLTHKLCHFVLGGTAAELTGGDFLAGATGATVGEIVADTMIQHALEQTREDVRAQLDAYRDECGELPPIQEAEFQTQVEFQLNLLNERYADLQDRMESYGRLAAAGTALLGHMDVATADEAAQNAIENNAVPSIDVLIENQHRSILEQLLAYSQAEIEEGVAENILENEAAVIFEPCIEFLCPGYELAKLGLKRFVLDESIPASQLALAGVSVLPVGKGCAIVSKGAASVAARIGFRKKVLSEAKISEKIYDLQKKSKRWQKLSHNECMEAFSRIGLFGTYEELAAYTKGFRGAIQAHHYALSADLCRRLGMSPNKAVCVILPDVWHYKTFSFGTKIFDENLRFVTAKGVSEVRHILQTEGIPVPNFNRELAQSVSSFIKNNPEVYGKK